jgi:hypothetical protein
MSGEIITNAVLVYLDYFLNVGLQAAGFKQNSLQAGCIS